MPHPDVLGYSLREYGNRVGVWRMLDVMDKHKIRCTVSLNLANFEMHPEIMHACEARGYDTLCHGIFNTSYLWEMPEDEERAYIAECVARFRKLTGRQLKGWFSPGVSYTPRRRIRFHLFGRPLSRRSTNTLEGAFALTRHRALHDGSQRRRALPL